MGLLSVCGQWFLYNNLRNNVDPTVGIHLPIQFVRHKNEHAVVSWANSLGSATDIVHELFKIPIAMWATD